MFCIRKIEVYDVKRLAGEIVSKFPEFEINPYKIDSYGDFDEMFDVDVEVEFDGITLAVIGQVRAQGYSKITTYPDPYIEPDHDFKQINEVFDLDYFIDGEEIDFDQKFDLEQEINKLI